MHGSALALSKCTAVVAIAMVLSFSGGACPAWKRACLRRKVLEIDHHALQLRHGSGGGAALGTALAGTTAASLNFSATFRTSNRFFGSPTPLAQLAYFLNCLLIYKIA